MIVVPIILRPYGNKRKDQLISEITITNHGEVGNAEGKSIYRYSAKLEGEEVLVDHYRVEGVYALLFKVLEAFQKNESVVSVGEAS